MPLWPYLRNLNGEGNAAPVGRSVGKTSAGKHLAGVFFERGFGVERIDVRRAAVHEQMNDSFGLRGERGALGQAGVGRAGGALVCADDQIPQCHRAKAHAAALQQLAAGEGQVFDLQGLVIFEPRL